jgi:hypothetical protein
LTNVLSGPRNADSKNEVKNYQGALNLVTTPDFELNLFRCLNPELRPMRDCTSIIFLNRPTFVWNFVLGDKARLFFIYPKTKFHIQKCNSSDIEISKVAELEILRWYSTEQMYTLNAN